MWLNSEVGTAGRETRERLIETAESLFATEGVNGVSLREIVRKSGARNVTALQYHFGDRKGLLRAVLDRHYRDVEASRHALLDAYEAGGTSDLRALATVLVHPLAPNLSQPAGPPYPP